MIEKLTKDERDTVRTTSDVSRPKAPRIIDTLTEALAAAERDTAGLLRGAASQSQALLDSQARVRELESKLRVAEGVEYQAEGRLAAAIALLETAPHAPGVRGQEWTRKRDTFLANQPAGPTRTEAFGAANDRVFTEHAPLMAALARTESEQAVLDAMANAMVASLRQLAALPEGVAYASVGVACRAELARRGLR